MKNFTVNAKSFQDMIDRYAFLTGKGMGDIVKGNARIVCVELARYTEPFAANAAGMVKAEETMKKAVRTGVQKVIRGPKELLAKAEQTSNDEIREKVKRMLAFGMYREVLEIFKALGVFKKGYVEISGQGQIAATHMQHRRFGRTKGPATYYFANSDEDVEQHISEVTKRIGYSKAGWADCARRLNIVKGDGARGIPAWAKKKKLGSMGGVIDRTRNKKNPKVEMTNNIPWIDRICQVDKQQRALKVGQGRMIKQMIAILGHAAKDNADMRKELVELLDEVWT